MTRAGDFYQESIKDTFRMLESYGDVIAIRHFQEGAPAEAAKWSSVPIINCGDGWGQHPTQVLTDLYTILLERGTLDGLTYLLVGDMRMRTMHSILHALSQFDAEAIVVSPPDMALMPEFKAELDAMSVAYREAEAVADVIGEADIIYMEPVVQADYTQSRVERGGEVGLTPEAYRVTARAACATKAKRSSIILHSLPRMDELTADVDETRHQRYWVEAFNGVVLRMALLSARPRRGRVGGPTMQTGLRGRDLISLQEWTTEEIETVLEVAAQLKRERALGIAHPLLRDRVLAMLFFFSSTRTRASFEAGHGPARRPRPVHREPDDPDRPRRHGQGDRRDPRPLQRRDRHPQRRLGRRQRATSARSRRPAACPVLNMQCDLYPPAPGPGRPADDAREARRPARPDDHDLVGLRRRATRSRSASRRTSSCSRPASG